MWFSSPHGDFSFSISWLLCLESFLYGFRPLTGISLFLWISFRIMTKLIGVFVPSRGFLFFYGGTSYDRTSSAIWFSSPHGDFSFSICITGNMWIGQQLFSSPHGDFSFSINKNNVLWWNQGFRPLTGISLFLFILMEIIRGKIKVFVPSRGFLFFYADTAS